ncbi:DUF6702 family protein [Soonwooa sp.]|uniref:DUF6702 family protein n=1 Tax=Soonwooa sp. TaxID=1938592 RepID=UPI0028A8FFE3|nr:DUF6702 family protein [Soonwooa sp.]
MKRFFLLLIAVCVVFSSFKENVHPYHVGSVEFSYNSKTKTFQISGKFFLDDMENALNKKYPKSLKFLDAKGREAINEALKNYCADYMKLKVNNQFVKINYLGFEEDSESVDVYLETEVVNQPQKVETSVSMLYNLFDDQLNIIHIIVNGNRKSEKLTFPNRYLYQQF